MDYTGFTTAALLMFFCCQGALLAGGQEWAGTQPPCQLDWDLSPCTCFDGNGLHCANVTLDELSKVLAPSSSSSSSSSTSLLPLLKRFSLVNFQIETFPASLLGKASLQHVYMMGCTVKHFEEGAFEGSRDTLTVFWIHSSSIDTLPVFSGFANIDVYSFCVRSSQVGNIPAHACSNTRCSISDSSVDTIRDFAFENSWKVDLGENVRIGRVCDFAFHNLYGQIMNLSGTGLSEKSMGSKTLSEMGCPGSTHLENNNLTTIPQALFHDFVQKCSDGRLESFNIYLSGNPIKCDQSLKWLVDKPAKYKSAFNFKCPNNGKYIENLTYEDLESA